MKQFLFKRIKRDFKFYVFTTFVLAYFSFFNFGESVLGFWGVIFYTFVFECMFLLFSLPFIAVKLEISEENAEGEYVGNMCFFVFFMILSLIGFLYHLSLLL